MAETRTSREFSITIRPGESCGVNKYEKDLLVFLDKECSHYVCAYEQKGDLSTQHFQIASIFTNDKRSDHLKTTLIGMFGDDWSPEMKRHAICVNKNRKNNDIRLLAGGYCMKQDATPFIKGWSVEELLPFQEQYDELKANAEKRNLTRDKVLDVLRDLHDQCAEHKIPTSVMAFPGKRLGPKLKFMYNLGIRQGYDLSKYYQPNFMAYLTDNFDSLFKQYDAEGLFDLLSAASV